MARLPLPPAEPMKLVHLAEIAKGGMGSVELARAIGGRFHGTALAIKRLHPNVAQDPQFVGMFLDEAWMTAALKSPNVVQVAAWGNDERGMFLAVELVQGVSLARLIKESRSNQEPFAERTVAFIGSQICAGMAAAHGLRGPDGASLGLVHRDLTPGNILVSFEGVVKIADFGIAKAEERITHTRTGTLKGKPAYMAPEQARGGKVDGRSDIFSFGVLMFEMLAGRRPWTAKAAFDVMMEASTAPTPDLGQLRKSCHPILVEVVHRCLEKQPDQRWRNAGEIQARLDAWRQSKNFEGDDASSLAHFVRRNSVRQIAWFEEALGGDLARQTNAPTFKEIEEKIDEARKGEAGAARVRPLAGRAELEALSAKAPKGGVRRDSASTPAVIPPGGFAAAPPAIAPPEVSLDARTIALDQSPLSDGRRSSSGGYPVSPRSSPEPYRPVPGGVTASGAETLERMPPLSKRSALAGTDLMSTAPFRGALARAGSEPRMSAEGAAVASGPHALASTLDEATMAAGRVAPRGPPSRAAVNAARPSSPQRTRPARWLLLLLVLPAIGFALVAAWRYRHRLLPATPASPASDGGAGESR